MLCAFLMRQYNESAGAVSSKLEAERSLSGPPEPAVAVHPQRSLAFMLLALHASIARGIEDWWSGAFLLAHLGLFLIRQPVWRGERVIFSAADRGALTVSDNGPAVSKSVAQELFSAPVHSQNGFGVGLYQSSWLAADFGYTLSLNANDPGMVSFVLASQPAA
jgi:hypothetical protein